MSKIKVIDALCGQGKSKALINYINSCKDTGKKFMYVTPFLSETERIKSECSSLDFKTPESKGSKIFSLKSLLSKQKNIVTTHSLFKKFDEETIDIAKLGDYTLVLDEVADVIEIPNISKYDLDTLLEKYVIVRENGQLEWVATEYRGEFAYYKKQCEFGSLYLYSSNFKQAPTLLWFFPVSIFKAFKEVYILTYLFDAQIQKYYYNYHCLDFEHLYVKDFKTTKEPQEYDWSEIKNLIHICDNKKLNTIGDDTGSLSLAWFQRNKNNVVMQTLKNNTYNYFRNISATSSDSNLWTTFKEYKTSLRGKGYTKGFASLSMRATNMYSDKTTVAYLANRYMNPMIKNFFMSKGIKIDEDTYALSELIQFLFRSQIRTGNPINVYIPSSRMRNLLKSWIEQE